MPAGKMGRELTLRGALKAAARPLRPHPAGLPAVAGLLTVKAVAADHALLTTEAQYFALQGVEQALEVIELARDSLNPELGWLGVVFNIADMRTLHTRESFSTLQEDVGRKLFRSTIRSSIAYAEARAPCRSSTTGPTSARTTSRSRTRCSDASGSPTPAHGCGAAAARLTPWSGVGSALL